MSSWAFSVERQLASIFDDVLAYIEANKTALRGVENYFFLALVGSRVNRYAKLERLIVTRVGNLAPLLFKQFFLHTREVEKPFDFQGILRRNMREYTVKVVLSDQAFNSTTLRRVEEASRAYVNPIILTVQGERFDPRDVGAAKWLCAHDSWAFVTGELDAYRKVRDMIFQVAKPYRERIFRLIDELDRL